MHVCDISGYTQARCACQMLYPPALGIVVHAVQVHATQCTLGDAHLPWWYQVEVIDNNLDSGSGEHEVGDAGSGDGLRGVGRFSVPRRQHELALCNQGSVSAR